MTKISLIVIYLLITVLAGCATATKSNRLSSFQKIQWESTNRKSVENILGFPDTTGLIHKSDKEALIYLAQDKKTPQLIVVFDKNTDQVISAHWYPTDKSEQWSLKQTLSHFPSVEIQPTPTIKKGAWGGDIAVYFAKDQLLSIDLDTRTQKLSSVSWGLSKDAPQSRKPTSH